MVQDISTGKVFVSKNVSVAFHEFQVPGVGSQLLDRCRIFVWCGGNSGGGVA